MSISKNCLLDEITQQPACLRQMLSTFPENFDGIKLPGFFTQKLIGIAEGSSYNALKIAAPFIEEFTGLNNFTFEPESLENKFEIAKYANHPIKRLFEKSFFLTVSQSGQTASLLKTVEQLQEGLGFSDLHAPMITFTNNLQGLLGSRYKNHFYLNAGEELSIAATKSMTASIMALLLFGILVGQKRGWLKRGDFQNIMMSLEKIPEKLEYLVQNNDFHNRLQSFSKQLCDTNQFVIVSKGPLSLILPEIGLKLTETSRNIVWTDNTESFKHGRKVILYGVKGERPNCLYIIPSQISASTAQQLFKDIYSHFYTDSEKIFNTDGVFFTVFENSPAVPDELKTALDLKQNEILNLPYSEGIESMFVGIVSFQLLSYYLALAKGEDPNNPALQKAVTR